MAAMTLAMTAAAVAVLSIFGTAFLPEAWSRRCGVALAASLSALAALGLSGVFPEREAAADTGEPADTAETYRPADGRALLVLAMMSVESEFNPLAEGKDGDTGVLQIRQIYVDEVNRILGREEYSLLDAYDVGRSLDMFDVLQGRHNPGNDFIKTIYCHNKSSVYKDRIIKEYNRLLLYERMRERIINRY